jgi:hypothetical protein
MTHTDNEADWKIGDQEIDKPDTTRRSADKAKIHPDTVVTTQEMQNLTSAELMDLLHDYKEDDSLSTAA